MFKNVTGQKLIVFAFDSTTNLPKTGDAANLTAYVSKDWGAVTVLGDTSATEMDATNAKGYYLFDLTQAETNGDCLLFSAKSSTANIVVIGVPATVYTTPPNFTALSISSGNVTVAGYASGQAPLQPTVAGRTLDVSAGGEAGVDWANVGSPTTAVDLSNTTIKTTQKVDVDTIKTGAVVNAGTVTFPTNATLASTTNITAGTITTATNLTTNNDKTGYALSSAGVQAIWDALTSALTTVGSIGKLLVDNIDATISSRLASSSYTAPDNGGIAAIQAKTDFLPSATAGSAGGVFIAGVNAATTVNFTGNLSGSVGSVTGAVGSVTGNVGGNVTGSVGSLAAQAQTDVRTAVGLAAANLDTQLSNISLQITGLNNLSAADVKAQMVDALTVDTYGEPAQGIPPTTASLEYKISFNYKSVINRKTQTNSQYSLYAADATTVDQKSSVADNGTTMSRGALVSGP